MNLCLRDLNSSSILHGTTFYWNQLPDWPCYLNNYNSLPVYIFPRWNLSIYFDFNLNCPLYNSAVLSLCLCLPLSFSVALTSFRSDRVCIHGVSETVQHIHFAAEIMSIFVSSLIQDRSYHSTLSTSPQLRLHRANSNGIIQQKQCS